MAMAVGSKPLPRVIVCICLPGIPAATHNRFLSSDVDLSFTDPPVTFIIPEMFGKVTSNLLGEAMPRPFITVARNLSGANLLALLSAPLADVGISTSLLTLYFLGVLLVQSRSGTKK